MSASPPASERGSVVAEFAVALPAVLVVLGLLLGGVQLVALQVRAQDAAADLARAWGRADGASAGAVLGRLPGASVSRPDHGGLVCATVTLRPAGPVARLGLTARATACALGGGA